MPLVVKDRVKETTTTTGTGTLTLAGVATGFQAFSVIGDGNTTYYTITDNTNFEVGIGTYTLSGTTLSRDTILESSNSGNAVNWGVGSKDVFVTYPAERSVFTDGSGITSVTGAVIINKTSITLDTVINTDENAFSIGPITVNGANLTVSSGAQYVVVAAESL